MGQKLRITVHRLVFGATALGLLMALGACWPPPPPPPPPTAHNLNQRMCIQPAGGLGSTGSPKMDGIVENDRGWVRAYRYVFENGTTVPDGVLQTIKDGTNLYLSFDVNQDDSFDAEDAVVIALDPDGAAGNYRRLHIFPFAPADPQPNGSDVTVPAQRILYWKGDPNNWGANQALPADVAVKRSSTFANQNSKWSIEVQLPLAGLGLPAVNYFGLYVAAFKVKEDLTYSENRWPFDALLQGNLFSSIETGTPAPDAWGNATFGGATCNGVYFSGADIATNHVPPSAISTDEANVFSVTAHNNSVDSTGASIAADGIRATFKIADFGLPASAQWHDVAVDGSIGTNPTQAPGPSIAANGATTLSAGGWTLSGPEQTQFAPPNEHQCIMVELDSTSPNTTFVKKTIIRNMNFKETDSPFDGVARIGTRGYKQEGQDAVELVLTEHAYNTTDGQPWSSAIGGLTPEGSNGRYVVRIPADQEQQIRMRISPPDVRIPRVEVRVPPGTGGPRDAVTVPVRAGMFVTVIADGTLELRGAAPRLVTPSGLPLRKDQADRTEAPGGEYLLDARFAPERLRGALVVSWDGFRDRQATMLAGSVRSLKVPDGVERLSLGINDTPDGFKAQGGDGYRVQVIATPGEAIYTYGRPIATRDPRYEELDLPLGINLPTWVMCGARKTGFKVQILQRQFERVEPVGCFGYALTRIGP